MAYKKKPSRKELLKEPDEFLSLSRRMLQFTVIHKKSITIAAAAFFVLLLAVAGFRYHMVRTEDRAFGQLREASAIYEAASVGKSALEAQRSAAEAFERLFARYGGKAAARIGRVIYADICYRAGDPKKAVELYTAALESFSEDPALSSLIHSGLGYAWEASGDLEQAAASFRKVAEGSDSIFRDDALFQLARISERMGKMAEGAKLYSTLPAEYPASLFSKIAKEKAIQDGGA
ncbi:MAG: tetratricopeptide repeat protein [Desulfobacterales bacterium]|jgi:tetratricopeptide (TPR) repeat protein